MERSEFISDGLKWALVVALSPSLLACRKQEDNRPQVVEAKLDVVTIRERGLTYSFRAYEILADGKAHSVKEKTGVDVIRERQISYDRTESQATFRLKMSADNRFVWEGQLYLVPIDLQTIDVPVETLIDRYGIGSYVLRGNIETVAPNEVKVVFSNVTDDKEYRLIYSEQFLGRTNGGLVEERSAYKFMSR